MRWMRAHIFSRASSLRNQCVSIRRAGGIAVVGGQREDVLGLADSVEELVPAVAHDGAHAEEDDAGTEAFRGEVSLP
jgi:hypothetical protein